MDETNGVRAPAPVPSAEIFAFPADQIIRPQPGARGQQVCVTYHGATTLYASPEALAAAIDAVRGLPDGPLGALREAEDLVRRAGAARDAWRARQRQAETLLRLIAIGAGVAALGGLLLAAAAL